MDGLGGVVLAASHVPGIRFGSRRLGECTDSARRVEVRMHEKPLIPAEAFAGAAKVPIGAKGHHASGRVVAPIGRH